MKQIDGIPFGLLDARYQAALTFPLAASLGGTGIANGDLSTLTLPNFPITIAGGVTGGVYTLPNTAGGGTVALLNTANVFTANQKINVNSTTAFFVEQDGVKDNVLVVDTTNGKIGVNNGSPVAAFDVISPSGTIPFSFWQKQGGTPTLVQFQTGATVADSIGYFSQYSATKELNYQGVYGVAITAGSGGVGYLGIYIEPTAGYTGIGGKPGSGMTLDVRGVFSVSKSQTAGNLVTMAGNLTNGGSVEIYSNYYVTEGSLILGTYSNKANQFVLEKTGKIGIGNITPLTKLHITNNTADTATVVNVLTVEQASTGTAANGLGAGLLFSVETATAGTMQSAGRVYSVAVDNTNATRKYKTAITAFDTAERIGIEVEADGTNPNIRLLGDTWWEGEGFGLPYGSFYGNDIAWSQAGAVQNTWYEISDTDIADGQLNLVTHDGSGKLTVAKAGRYLVNYRATVSCNTAGKEVQTGISVSGTEANDGIDHEIITNAAAKEGMSSTAILDLAANATIEISIRTTDTGTPDISVEHINVTVLMVGGT